MSIFQGLYAYECIMLVLGIVLFFAGLYRVLRGDEAKKQGLLFMFAIIMIGYPSIQSIKYKDGVITIEKTTAQLQANPTNSAQRRLLQTTIDKLGPRILSNSKNADTLAAAASAQYALGQEDVAKVTLQKASEINPHARHVVALQNRIAVFENLSEQSAAVHGNASDEAAKAKLKASLDKASTYQTANPNALMAVAKAQSALGETESANKAANIAHQINPGLQLHPEPP